MRINKICIAESARTKEALSQEFTDKICKFDAPIVGDQVEVFFKDNKFSYYVCINCWLLLASDMSRNGNRRDVILRDMIIRHGLIQTVYLCNEESQKVINNEPLEDRGCELLVRDMSKKDALQLLRYAKRLSLSSKILEERSLEAFFSTNQKCFEGYYNDDFTFLAMIRRSMRHYLSEMFAGYSSNNWESQGSIPGGACAHDPGESPINTYTLKVIDILKRTAYFMHPLYPGRTLSTRPPRDSITPMAVPKSYKTYRIIAPDDAYRQFCMSPMRKVLESLIDKNGYSDRFNVHDQEMSRTMCYTASLDGHLATVDFSAASDSISRALAKDILPEAVYSDSMNYLPKYFLKGKQRRKARMLASAGSGITFVLEGAIFLSLSLAVTDYVQRWFDEPLSVPVVYGDDCIIDQKTYDTFLCVSQKLGFTISENKSYASLELLYREACGAECEVGLDLSSVYFPRRFLKMEAKSRDAILDILIQHQHRMVDFYSTQMFLCSVVRHYVPDFTSHKPGTICTDLWEDLPVYTVVRAPMKRGVIVSHFPEHVKDSGACFRERHYRLVDEVSVPDSRFPGHISIPADTQLARYVEFLRFGPKYDDELSRLLGVSSQYLSLKDVYPSSPRFKLTSE